MVMTFYPLVFMMEIVFAAPRYRDKELPLLARFTLSLRGLLPVLLKPWVPYPSAKLSEAGLLFSFFLFSSALSILLTSGMRE